MATPHHASPAVRRTLRKLGQDLHDARRRRRLTMSVVADRAFTTRVTLQRIEKGNPRVSVGIYAAVLQALGLLESLGDIADFSRDIVGQALVTAQQPKRSRLRRPKTDNG